MATGRYHQFGVTDPTSNFFKLDYQMLAQPILKADQEYKQLDDSYNQFNQQLSSKEVLPEDVPALNERVKNLQEAEKKLRGNVNGDILDPRYQEGLRGLVQKESQDNFYRGSTWNLNLYKQRQQYRKEYAMKFGETPDAWQDPTQSFFDKYEGFDKSGFGEDNPIDPRFPYHEKAVEYAEPAIKKKIETGEWKEFTTYNNGVPEKFLMYENGQRVSKEELKRIIKLSTIGDGTKPWNQLQTIYENSPDLKAKYKDFETYYNEGVLESVASSLAYAWEDKSRLVNVNSQNYSNSESSERTKKLQNKLTQEKVSLKINEGAKDWVEGVSNPLSYPDMKLAMKARQYYDAKSNDILNGFWARDEQGNRVQVPDMQTRVYDAFGIAKNNKQGIKIDVSPNQKNGELGVFVNYTSKDGVARTVDILSGEGLLRKGEMPDELASKVTDVMLKFAGQSAEYAALKHQQDEIDRFQNKALTAAFGDKQAKVIKEQGFNAILNAEEREKFNLQPAPATAKSLANKIRAGLGITKEDFFAGTGFRVVPVGRSFTSSAEQLKVLSDAMSIPYSVWNKKGANKEEVLDNFIAAVNTARKQGNIAKNDAYDILTHVQENIASEILKQRKGGGMERYEKLWKDQWSKGLDEDMNPLTQDDNPEGLKATQKLMYYYNQTNTTGEASSGKYWKGGKELLAAQMGYRVGADGDQRATFSNMEMFHYNSNKQVTDYKKFADPKNWDLVGITVDDEGFNIVIKDNNPTSNKKKGDSWIEIRNSDMVIDYMVQAGMGDKLIFDTPKQMLKGFEDSRHSENREFSPVQEDINLPYGVGRTRGAAVIGKGIFERPIQKLESTFIDPATKQKHEPGTFKYYSLSQEKFIYTVDPVEATKQYLIDRDFVMNQQGGEYQAFSSDTFGGRVKIAKEIVTDGYNTMHSGLLNILTDTIFNDPLLPGTLTMTSATRDKQAALSQANPASKHIMGKAVDFAVSKGSGVDDNIVEFFNQKSRELAEVAYVTLEFPAGDKRARAYKEKYGDFVSVEDHATGAHIHIEYKQ